VDGFNAVTSYTYDVLDRVLSETMPNGNVTTFTYDAVSNVLEERATTQEGTLVLKDTFTYDANGNKLSRVETALKNITVYKTETHTYDAVNQLIETVSQEQVSEKYFYDSLGNRIRKEVFDPNENKPEIKVTTYTYNNENQMLALQGPDEEVGGHMTSDPVTFTYDARGNLTRIQTLDAPLVSTTSMRRVK
jgi:YD repeat-containing protein